MRLRILLVLPVMLLSVASVKAEPTAAHGPIQKKRAISITPSLEWNEPSKIEQTSSAAFRGGKPGEQLDAKRKHESPPLLASGRGKGGRPVVSASTFQKSHVFTGNHQRLAQLPSVVLERPLFVNVALIATPGTDDANGTTINIGGASVTVMEGQSQDALTQFAVIAVKDVDNNGQPVWRRVPWQASISSNGCTVPIQLSIKLDPKSATWSLYHYDIIIARDLPMAPGISGNEISVRGGNVPTDIAVLRAISVTDTPTMRKEALRIPLKSNQLDIQSAQAQHDPRLHIVSRGAFSKKSK